MATLQNEIINDLLVIERDLGSPAFTWQNASYSFIPSVSDFTRELDTGGYKIIKLLTATIRKLNEDGTPVFTNGYPQPQQIINYVMDGTNYRIETVKQDPTGAYMRIVAHSTVKGL